MSKIRISTPSQLIPTLKRSISSKRVHFDEAVRVMFIPNRIDIIVSSWPQTIWWDIHDYKRFQTDALLELASFMKLHPLIANKRAAYRKMFQSPMDHSCKWRLYFRTLLYMIIVSPHDDDSSLSFSLCTVYTQMRRLRNITIILNIPVMVIIIHAIKRWWIHPKMVMNQYHAISTRVHLSRAILESLLESRLVTLAMKCSIITVTATISICIGTSKLDLALSSPS